MVESSCEKIADIRNKIILSKNQNITNQKLLGDLESKVCLLHGAIKLPNLHAPVYLLDFVFQYIDQIPIFLEGIVAFTKRRGCFDEVESLIVLVSDYFLTPSETYAMHPLAETLLIEAYSSHRLIEEYNDRFMALTGESLTAMDMTRANVVVHEIIGEPFANYLDQAVFLSSQLLAKSSEFAAERNNNARMELYSADDYFNESWPCFIEQLDINLAFGNEEGLLTH